MGEWQDYATYDAALHDEKIAAHARAVGFDWLEGEEKPTANEMLNEFEELYRVALPDGTAGDLKELERLQRLVRRKFNEGKNDLPV